MARLRTMILCFILACIALSATAAEPGVLADDRADRDRAIHWPRAFDPSVAPVFSHNELLIHADCHRVWTQLTDVTRWPDWFVLTKDVSIDGGSKTVQQGTVIRLKIFGSPIISSIAEFVPDSRLSWIPQGIDDPAPPRYAHYHAWHLLPESAACRVITEETGVGPEDAKSPESGSRVMHRAHDLWLASLKWVSEI